MDFYFIFFSIGLGAPLGLILKPQNLIFYFSILISYFCGMSFLGLIFNFLFVLFYWVGGSPRPDS